MPKTFFMASASLALSLACAAAHSQDFKVVSNSVVDGRFASAQYANVFGCTGKNVSPHIAWQGAPQGTKSFVVTVYDPDAPTGSGWWHWVVADIPARVTELPQGAGSGKAPLPAGALQTRTDFGPPGYGGAAPPPGAPHRYIFTVHALKVPTLGLNPDVSPAYVGFNVHFNSLGSATLTATYPG
jgi:Raf kinase inhibitor-like YbhB/YbcL family protein